MAPEAGAVDGIGKHFAGGGFEDVNDAVFRAAGRDSVGD
jgi:hypothetical protein